MDSCSTQSCSSCGPWWRLPLLLALVLAAVWLIRGRGIRESTTESGREHSLVPAIAETDPTIALAIDFGNERRREFDPIPWHEGMTVRDALAAATEKTDGVKFSQQGSGASAFLTQIDGVKNEGSGGRNWTYTVNGTLGDRSFAICPLDPGDRVLWAFAVQQ